MWQQEEMLAAAGYVAGDVLWKPGSVDALNGRTLTGRIRSVENGLYLPEYVGEEVHAAFSADDIARAATSGTPSKAPYIKPTIPRDQWTSEQVRAHKESRGVAPKFNPDAAPVAPLGSQGYVSKDQEAEDQLIAQLESAGMDGLLSRREINSIGADTDNKLSPQRITQLINETGVPIEEGVNNVIGLIRKVVDVRESPGGKNFNEKQVLPKNDPVRDTNTRHPDNPNNAGQPDGLKGEDRDIYRETGIMPGQIVPSDGPGNGSRWWIQVTVQVVVQAVVQ